MLYDDFRDVPSRHWPCEFFKPVEIACRGTGELLVNRDALLALDMFRVSLGKPVMLSSAYRSAYHNAKVGGAPRSQHRTGGAFDVRMLPGYSKEMIREAAEACGFRGFGMRYQTFVHIDMGKRREW